MVLFNRFGLAPLAVSGTGLESVFQAAENAASQFAKGMAGAVAPTIGGADLTRATIERTDAGAKLEVIVPGFGPDDIELSIKRDSVSVRGERGEDSASKHTFARTYRTGFPIDVDAVKATVEHGILTIELPRHASESPRVVKIDGQTKRPRIENNEVKDGEGEPDVS